MNWLTLGFFCAGLALGGYLIVSEKKLIYSIMGFLLTTLMVAGLMAMIGAELPSVSQILIYSGGLVVLMLFALMIWGAEPTFKAKKKVTPAILAISVVLFFASLSTQFVWIENKENVNLNEFAQLLFGKYFLTFELLGLLLLLILICSLYLVND